MNENDDQWKPVDAPDYDPPLLNREVAPSAELYEVYQGPNVKPLKVIRIRQYRKASPPHHRRRELPGEVSKDEGRSRSLQYGTPVAEYRPPVDERRSSDHRSSAFEQKFERGVDAVAPKHARCEVTTPDEKEERPSVKTEMPSITDDGMGRKPTGRSMKSMKSRKQRSTIFSETLAEIVKDRKAEGMKEALKAKIYEKDMMAKNVGSKAAEVVKSMDVDLSRLDKQRRSMHEFISSSFFDSFIGLIILVNAVIIGFEAEVSVQIPFGCDELCKCDQANSTGTCFPMPQWLQAVDYVFAAVYIAEFGLRLYTYGIPVLRSNWVKFDLFLILSSMLDIALKQVATVSEVLTQILLVRILRLARLARAVRLMVQFRVLWQLVQGLLHSVSTLLWTFLMVMILVYGFAIVGIETIHVDLSLPLDHPYNIAALFFLKACPEPRTENFESFSDAMLSLFQCFTLDSSGEIYRPLISHNPALIAYFMTVILIMAVSLMNLVTAVMVNSALDQASEDKDVKRAYEAVQKRKQLEQLKVMFLELDSDGSGELTLEELKESPEEVREQLKEVAGTEDIEGLFQMLDYDGGGILRASTSEKPLELTRLVKQCSDILKLCRNMYVHTVQSEKKTKIDTGDLEKQIKQFENKVETLQLDMNDRMEQLQSDLGRIMNVLQVEGR
eukprot:symbB.v1.2.031823.t1/scaffold3737.1/size52626/3